MLNLHQVRAFVAVAEAGGFAAAAERLGLAQPTVSQQVAKLEDVLGVALFRRGRGNCPPTPQGRELLSRARSLLEQEQAFRRAAHGGSLRFGCGGNVASYLIAESLRRFLDQETDEIEWTMRCAPNPELVDLLEAGELDLAILEWMPRAPTVIARPWRRERLIVIVPPQHPLAGSDAVDPSLLEDLDLIGGEPGSGTGSALREALGPMADKLRITHNVGGTEAVKDAVAAGLGASIVMESAARRDLETGRLATLSPQNIEFHKTLYIATSEAIRPGTPASSFADFLASIGDGTTSSC